MTAGRRKQDSLDRYDTPPEVTRAFLAAYRPDARWYPNPPSILEPSAGSGAMLPPLRAAFPGARIYAFDIEPRAEGIGRQDFLEDLVALGQFDIVITNPPFRLAEQFLRQSMNVITDDGTVILLLRAAFLESKRRANLLDEFPPTEIYFLRDRPHFTGPNTKSGTDTAMYAWFVWRKRKGKHQDYFEGYLL